MTLATCSTCTMNLKRLNWCRCGKKLTNRTGFTRSLDTKMSFYTLHRGYSNTMISENYKILIFFQFNIFLGIHVPVHVHLNTALTSKLITKYQKLWKTIRNTFTVELRRKKLLLLRIISYICINSNLKINK